MENGAIRLACSLLSGVLSAAAVLAQPADLTLETVITGLNEPIAARHAGDGSGRLFIADLSGMIHIWDGQGTSTFVTPFLDITGDVASGNERGLLGLAFHPKYSSNGRFFVSYKTQTGERLVIERFSVSAGDPNVADLASRSVLLEIVPLSGVHSGGDLHFGPDGYLYIGIGDGDDGSAGYDLAIPQDLGQLRGKMLRLDVDTPPQEGMFELCGETQNYSVPPDNPYVGVTDACDEIWHSGLRNPWRWSFDRETGDLFLSDVGAGSWEEVNFQPAESVGGENWGWPCREGTSDFMPRYCTGGETLLDPLMQYSHAGGRCAVIGGFVYRGGIPDMNGRYIYSDWCTGEIWFATETSPGVWTTSLWQDLDGFSSAGFGEDEAGEVYLTQVGAVARFESATSPGMLLTDGFESGDTSAWSSATKP